MKRVLAIQTFRKWVYIKYGACVLTGMFQWRALVVMLTNPSFNGETTLHCTSNKCT